MSQVPNLTADGTDKEAKKVAGPLGLSVRGTGGEHTPIGKDGTVDISPRARLFIKEAEIIAALYDGLLPLLIRQVLFGIEQGRRTTPHSSPHIPPPTSPATGALWDGQVPRLRLVRRRHQGGAARRCENASPLLCFLQA